MIVTKAWRSHVCHAHNPMKLSKEKQKIYDEFIAEVEKEEAEMKQQRVKYDELMAKTQETIDQIMKEAGI
jgi:hypothetical protein